eukprot:1144014-Pelagomonas_calceolata.AAC.3
MQPQIYVCLLRVLLLCEYVSPTPDQPGFRALGLLVTPCMQCTVDKTCGSVQFGCRHSGSTALERLNFKQTKGLMCTFTQVTALFLPTKTDEQFTYVTELHCPMCTYALFKKPRHGAHANVTVRLCTK